MSDIDIERLRHALKEWDHGETRIAAQWLLALADEGGELVLFKPCEHGWLLCGDSDCDGGSRKRVWPPKEDN